MTSLSVNYTVPPFGIAKQNKWARGFLSGWKLGTISTWQSGALLQSPGSNNAIGSFLSTGYTRQVRVAGVPLYLKDPELPLHRPDTGNDSESGRLAGSGTRCPRAATSPITAISAPSDGPSSRAALGLHLVVHEKASFSLRAEFFNLLNQNLSIAPPSTGSPATPPTRSNGTLTGGFGFLNYLGIASNSVNSSLPTPPHRTTGGPNRVLTFGSIGTACSDSDRNNNDFRRCVPAAHGPASTGDSF